MLLLLKAAVAVDLLLESRLSLVKPRLALKEVLKIGAGEVEERKLMTQVINLKLLFAKRETSRNESI